VTGVTTPRQAEPDTFSTVPRRSNQEDDPLLELKGIGLRLGEREILRDVAGDN